MFWMWSVVSITYHNLYSLSIFIYTQRYTKEVQHFLHSSRRLLIKRCSTPSGPTRTNPARVGAQNYPNEKRLATSPDDRSFIPPNPTSNSIAVEEQTIKKDRGKNLSKRKWIRKKKNAITFENKTTPSAIKILPQKWTHENIARVNGARMRQEDNTRICLFFGDVQIIIKHPSFPSLLRQVHQSPSIDENKGILETALTSILVNLIPAGAIARAISMFKMTYG